MKIDFTNCEINRFKTYGGANGAKRGIIYNGETYMLKLSQKTKINNEMSYANSAISEYIGCKIYELLGISVQETSLGTYFYNEKEKISVACKDMEVSGYKLKDFASLKNTIIDSERGGYGTDLFDVLNTLEEQNFVSSIELKNFFWNMFVVDAFIGNFDRHNGNWGFLVNEEKEDIKIAPIYDCGSCLFSEMDNDLMVKVMSDKTELEYRIYVVPKSVLMINKKKISYYDFLTTTDNKDLIASIKSVVNRIDFKKIEAMIDEIEYINDISKTFYKFILRKRKELILDVAMLNLSEK